MTAYCEKSTYSKRNFKGSKTIKYALICMMLGIFLIVITAFSLTLYHNHAYYVLKADKIEQLSRLEHGYKENSLILMDTDYEEAQALADRLGATLRTGLDGSFASMTLPEGMTITDVYEDEANRPYLSRIEANSYVKLSDWDGNHDLSGNVSLSQTVTGDITKEPGYVNQGYLQYIGLEDVHKKTKGAGVTVAIIDSGINYRHEEFSGIVSDRSYNASTQQSVKNYGFSIINDTVGHGTNIAGVIAAQHNGRGIGGIAPDVELMVIKVNTTATGYMEVVDVAYGLEYILRQGNVDVVNLSLGMTDSLDAFNEFFELMEDAGIVCVAAAGNDGVSTLTYPACLPTVIGVGALAHDYWELAAYSNRGSNVDIVAPGTIYTSGINAQDDYGINSGTSFAAPSVTAAVALYKSLHPNATPTDIREELFAYSKDLGDAGHDALYGYGALNIANFIKDKNLSVTEISDFSVSTMYEMYRDQLPIVRYDAVEVRASEYDQGSSLLNPEKQVIQMKLDGWSLEDYFGDGWNQGNGKFRYDGYKESVPTDSTAPNVRDLLSYTFTVPQDGTYELVFLAAGEYTGGEKGFAYGIDGGNVYQINCTDTKGIYKEQKYEYAVEDLEADGEDVHSPYYQPAYYYNLTVTLTEGIHTLQFYPLLTTSDGKKCGGNDHGMELISFYVQKHLSEEEWKNYEYPGKRPVYKIPSQGLEFYNLSNGEAAVAGIGTCTDLHVVIPERAPNGRRVTEIYDIAFFDTDIVSITIPASVRRIGEYGLSDCPMLESVIFMHGKNDPLYIANYAFEDNESLTEIWLTMKLTNLGENAFCGCTALQKVVLSDSLEKISDGAFEKCTALKEVNIPANAKYVGGFSGCVLLDSFALPKGVETLGQSAFSYTAIKSIHLPESLKNIHSYAFGDCVFLEEIDIPNGVVTLGESAFSGCKSLRRVSLPENLKVLENKIFWGCNALEEIHFPPTLTTIGDYAFSSCYSLKTAILPNSVNYLGKWAFFDCQNLQTVYIPSSVTTVKEEIFDFCADLKEIYIDSVAFVSALSADESPFSFMKWAPNVNILIAVEIPWESENLLDNFAYREAILCGDRGYMSFSHHTHRWMTHTLAPTPCVSDGFDGKICIECQLLSGVKVSSHNWIEIDIGHSCIFDLVCADCGVASAAPLHKHDYQLTKTEGPFCFDMGFERYTCTKCNQEKKAYTMPSVGHRWSDDHICQGCKKRLPLVASYDISADKSGSLTGKIFELIPSKSYALEIAGTGEMNVDGGYLMLPWINTEYGFKTTMVVVQEGIEQLMSGSFYKLSSLTDVRLPSTLKGIESITFMECRSLERITLPENLTYIGSSAFSDCKKLSEVIIPNSVTTIESFAFCNCAALTEINIPDSVTFCGKAMFQDCVSLERIKFSKGMRELPNQTFEGCTGLSRLTLPDELLTIGESAFIGCTGLTEIIFSKNLQSVGVSAFEGCTGLVSVTIPDAVTVLERGAFRNCSGLTQINMGDSLKTIGAEAFKDCTALTTVTMRDAVTNIGRSAFQGCTALMDVRFSEDLISVEDYAFSGCASLTELRLPVKVTDIGGHAFENCSAIRNIYLPDGVTHIGIGAFLNCILLEEIVIPDAVSVLERDAFEGCRLLKTITLPTNATSVWDAFFICPAIRTIYVRNPFVVYDDQEVSYIYYTTENILLPADMTRVSKDLIYDFKYTCTVTQNGVEYTCYSKCNHAWSKKIVNVQSCKTDGFSGRVCTKCNLWDGEEKDAHNWQEIPVGNSCYTYRVCTKCGEADYTLLSHHVYEITEIVEPTCTDYGYSTMTCTHCGVVHIRDFVLPLGHNYTRWLNTVPPTCEKEGYSVYGCERCDARQQRDYVSRLDHTYTVDIEVIPPTCTEDGYTILGCERCDRTSKGKNTSAFGHTWHETAVCPVCEEMIPQIESWNISKLSQKTITAAVYELLSGKSHVMTIIGSGETVDWTSAAEVPWHSYRKTLRAAYLDENLTSIGGYAFYDCETLEHINIHHNLKYIGDYAFSYCHITGELDLRFCHEVGAYAFAECREIEKVYLSDYMTVLKAGVFEDCYDLKYVDLPSGLKIIETRAFLGCNSLRYLLLPATVTEVHTLAFFGSSIINIGLEAKALPSVWEANGNSTVFDVKAFLEQGDYLFTVFNNGEVGIQDYTGAEEILEIPATAGQYSVSRINDYAFRYARHIKQVILPSGIKSIGTAAFYGCTSLRSVMIPAQTNEIGKEAFYDCPNVVLCFQGATLPTTLVYGWRGTAAYCLNAHGVILEDDSTFILTAEGTLFLGRYYGDGEQYVLPESVNNLPVTGVGCYAMEGCTNLKTVILHAGVRELGNYAFSGQEGISIGFASEKLPEKLGVNWNGGANHYLGVHQFVQDDVATYVLFNDGTAMLNAYKGTAARYVIPADIHGYPVTVIGSKAFYANATLTSVVFTSNLLRIEDSAFESCAQLQEIIWSEEGSSSRLISIGASAFSRCTALTEMTFPESLLSIGTYAFNSCTALAEITFTEGITTVEAYAFSGCRALTEITLPESLKNLEGYAFYNCPVLSRVYLLSVALEDVEGTSPFYQAGSFSVIVGSQVSRVPAYLFSSTSVTSVVFEEDGVCQSIGAYAFSGCRSLKNIVLPESLTLIGQHAFNNCSALEEITYPKSLQKVESQAFRGCYSLKKFVILSRSFAESVSDSEDLFGNSMSVWYVMIPADAEAPFFAENYSVSLEVSYPQGNFVAYANHQHSWETANMERIPCEQSGFVGEACTTCGLRKGTFTDMHTRRTESTEMGCGYHLVCVDCGDVQMYYEHAYETHHMVAPTCTEQGYTVFRCIYCDKEMMGEEVDAIGHDLSFVIETIPPTCTEAGYHRMGCVRCEHEENVGAEAALGHVFDQWLECLRCHTMAEVKASYDVSVDGDGSVMAYVCQYQASDYALIIKGNGPMKDYLSEADTPWYQQYWYNLKRGIVTEGVTHIGAYTFAKLTYLNQCDLPEGLTSIGQYAFSGLSRLTSLTLPQGLTTIEAFAFYNAYNINSICIPKTVERIESDAFTKCSFLKTIYLDSPILARNATSKTSFGNLFANAQTIAVSSEITDISSFITQQRYSITVSYGGKTYVAHGSCMHLWQDYAVDAEGCLSAGFTGKKCGWCQLMNGEMTDGHQWESVICEEKCYEALRCRLCDAEKDIRPYHAFEAEEQICPTCTEQGYTVYKCVRCGVTEMRDYVDALGHTLDVVVETVPPTCTEQGYTVYKCVRCDATEARDYVDALGHTLDVVVETVPPTCTEQGYTVYKCVRCDVTEMRDYVDALGHTMDVVVETVPPTCTEQGYTVYECTACLTHISEKWVDALGHAYGEDMICSVCGNKATPDASYKIGSDMTAHMYTLHDGTHLMIIRGTGEMDLSYEGSPWRSDNRLKKVIIEEGVESIDSNGFRGCTGLETVKFPESLCLIESYAFASCFGLKIVSIPNEICVIESFAFRDCVALTEVTLPDQATNMSIEYGAFSNCTSLKLVRMSSVPLIESILMTNDAGMITNHRPTLLLNPVAQVSDYVKQSYAYVETVSYDGETYVVYSAHRHEWEIDVWLVEQVPCEQAGSRVEVCTRCNVKRTVRVDAHRLQQYGERLPACTVPGHSAYEACLDCDYTTYVEIPATGHDFCDWDIVESPTCTGLGLQKRLCRTCSTTETKAIPAVGHPSTDMVEDNQVEPTCTEEGHYDLVYYCTVCKEELSRETIFTEALGHDYKATVTAPTCTEKGHTTHTCTRCGDSYTDTVTEALGHRPGDWIVDKEPEAGVEGSKYKACVTCGEILENGVIEALPDETDTETDELPGTEEPTDTETGEIPGTEEPTDMETDENPETEEPTVGEPVTNSDQPAESDVNPEKPKPSGGCSGTVGAHVFCVILLMGSVALLFVKRRKETI